MNKRILCVITVIMLVLGCTVHADTNLKPIYDTDLEYTVCYDMEKGSYLEIEGPEGTFVQYYDGNYADCSHIEWSDVSPRHNDNKEHDVSVKVFGKEYEPTVFCFSVYGTDEVLITGVNYDNDTLSLTSNLSMNFTAQLLRAEYDVNGVLTGVQIHKVQFEDGFASVKGDFSSGRLFVWKSLNGKGALKPMCEKINLDELGIK